MYSALNKLLTQLNLIVIEPYLTKKNVFQVHIS